MPICPHCIAAGVSFVALAMAGGSITHSIAGSWQDIKRALRGERIESAFDRYEDIKATAARIVSNRHDLTAPERSTIAE